MKEKNVCHAASFIVTYSIIYRNKIVQYSIDKITCNRFIRNSWSLMTAIYNHFLFEYFDILKKLKQKAITYFKYKNYFLGTLSRGTRFFFNNSSNMFDSKMSLLCSKYIKLLIASHYETNRNNSRYF